MGLTDEEVADVKADWKSIQDKTHFGLLVFSRLFAENPDYLKKFKKFEGLSFDEVKASDGLKWHAQRFSSAISAVVGVLEDADAVHVILHELGRAHTTRNVHEEEIKKAVNIFHSVLAEELGSSLRSASGWSKVVDVILHEMGDGLKI